MIKGKMVKARFKRYFSGQCLWVFVGKVLEYSENWVQIEGKGLVFNLGQVSLKSPIEIDNEIRILIIPRENIAHIRVLPDNFDLTSIETERKGFRYYISVKDGPDASLGEVGETV